MLHTKLLEDSILACLGPFPEGLISSEMNMMTAKHLKLSPETLDLRTPDGTKNLFAYRMAWARTHLKNRGLIAMNSNRRWVLVKGDH